MSKELNTGMAGIGHNSGAAAAPESATGVAVERLRSIVDRIERLEEERKALSGDIRDIFAEAKSAGFDVKVLRDLLKLRKLNPNEADERANLLDIYRKALGM